MRQRVLLYFVHPSPRRSRINRSLLTAAKTVPDIDIVDLYELYPDFHIDIKKEQQRLLDHDIIVFQHPMFWYSCPALLKEWIDAVLELGWAYGKGGDKLKGKHWFQAISAGGPSDSYGENGYNHFSLPELLRPFELTAGLCGMLLLPPFLIPGAGGVLDSELAQRSKDYARVLSELREGRPSEYFSTKHREAQP